MRYAACALACTLAAAAPAASSAVAQELPLAPLRGEGQPVWPAYEGWYEAPDGTKILYFGYQNRNAETALDIPLGERNFIEPKEFDGAQPTWFAPGRDWGVFGIRVPADFPSEQKIYWNLVIDGRTYRVPGHTRPDWKTDA
ncbi:MAG TPA: hypothetical protein VFQ22_06270, partial [Longimicrobiales bacterium]|nr:hypothetical protein [Longimicrobiales bacterium]